MRRVKKGWSCALGAFGLAIMMPLSASGQASPVGSGAAPAASPSLDATNRAAKEHYEAGVKAANTGNWAKAVEDFGIAYALVGTVQIAGNLGHAELKLGEGHYRDAAKHLSRYVLENTSLKGADKKAADGWLAEAKKHVATLRIQVGTGVEVRIDNKSLGTALPPEVFVDAGQHTIVALAGKARAEEVGTFSVGETRVVSLEPKEPVVGPVAGATHSATMTQVQAGVPAEPSMSPGRKALLVTGGVVGLGLVGAGAGLRVALEGTKSDTARQLREIRGNDQTSAPCRDPAPALLPACKKNADMIASGNLQGDLGMGLLVAGGAVIAGTVTVYLLSKPGTTQKAALVIPVASANAGGVLAQFKF